MPVQGRVVSLAVQAALVAATGRSCGYGAAPVAADKPTGNTVPYCVLYPSTGGTSSGPPFGDSSGDGRVPYQITSIGTTAEQAEWMADKVRAALFGKSRGSYVTPIVAAGHTVMEREIDKEDGVSVVGGVYSYITRIILHVTTPDS